MSRYIRRCCSNSVKCGSITPVCVPRLCFRFCWAAIVVVSRDWRPVHPCQASVKLNPFPYRLDLI